MKSKIYPWPLVYIQIFVWFSFTDETEWRSWHCRRRGQWSPGRHGFALWFMEDQWGLFGENAPKKVALKSGAGSMVDPVKIPTSALLAYAKKNRKDKLKILVRGDGRGESAGSAFTPRMSSAVDARLDKDLEMSAEWFLKMSSLMEAETVQSDLH